MNTKYTVQHEQAYRSECGSMDLALALFLGIIVIVLLAFVIGASASASPFHGNVVTTLYNWIVSLFV